MQLPGTRTKPFTDMNYQHDQRQPVHRCDINRTKNSNSRNDWPNSPTFPKAILLKPFELEYQPHIFDTPQGPSLISPDSSFESSEAMDISISPSTSNRSHPHHFENHFAAFGTIGLPSEYPLQKTESPFTSMILDDDEGFDVVIDEPPFSKSRTDSRSSESCRNGHDSIFRKAHDDLSLSVDGIKYQGLHCSSLRQPTHHRQRLRLGGSTENFQAMAVSCRRRRNYALCEKDFEEHVLKDLFSDISAHAFSY